MHRNVKFVSLRIGLFALSMIYSCLVLLVLFFRWIRNPTKNVFSFKVRDSQPACLRDPNLGEHQFIKLKNIKLHYVEKGNKSKPLMLFLHGFPEFWYTWRHQIKEFSKDYWTVAVDMRGYGESDKPSEINKYTRKELINDIKGLIEGLGRKSCVLVAHDWGGAIAWNFITFHPEYVDKYIIMNAPHSGAYHDAIMLYKKQFFLSWYMFFFQLPFLPELFIKSGDMSTFKMLRAGCKNSAITDEDIEAFKYTFAKQSVTGPINYYRANLITAIDKERKTKPTKKITVPGLLIWGDKDAYLDRRIPELTKKYAEDLKIEMIVGANHFVQQDDPVSTNAAMRRFLGSGSS